MRTTRISNDATALVARFFLFLMLHSELIVPLIHMEKSDLKQASPIFEAVDSEKRNNAAEEIAISQTNRGSVDVSTSEDELVKKAIKLAVDHSEAIIGSAEVDGYDNPSDNFFTTFISKENLEKYDYYLEFEIKGCKDYLGLPISINHSFITGSYLFEKNDTWLKKSILIDPTSLNEGNNSIYFGSIKNTYAELKNFKLIGKLKETSSKELIANFRSVKISDNKLLIKFDNPLGKKLYCADLKISFSSTKIDTVVLLPKNKEFEEISIQSSEDAQSSTKISIQRPAVADSEEVAIEKYNLQESKLDLERGYLLTPLNTIDLPHISKDVRNCTANGAGVRILDISKNTAGDRLVKIPFDVKRIPDNTKPSQIKCFYFDKSTKNWKQVTVLSVNTTEKYTLVKSNGEGDYINGIISAPEASETSGYAPTTISGMKTADPFAEMTFISPPQANNQGTANISYPIKIPSGRNGMQPNVILQYSNNSGAGTLGQGWNLPISSISLDTRWGTPTFDVNYESEIYLLDGEQLMHPRFEGSDWMPHRPHNVGNLISTEPQPRSSSQSTRFTFRKANNLSKVERIGTSTTNYIWKVTTTDGIINYYGGDEQGANENSIIRNDLGNIVRWSIFKTVDYFGNNVIYEYKNHTIPTSNLTAENSNLTGGRVFEIEKIFYTGKNGNQGSYQIKFNYQNSITKKEILIDNKLGLKMISPFLMENLEVKWQNTLIRSYEFNYKLGEFQKILLEKITEKHPNLPDNTHTFTYYDNNIGKDRDLSLYEPPVTIPLPQIEDLNLPRSFSNLIPVSKINSTRASETGYNLHFAGGLEVKFGKHSNNRFRTLTIGTTYGEAQPRDLGLINLGDLNGDGLNDLIYRSKSGLKYFPSFMSENNQLAFLEAKNISGINNYNRSTGYTQTIPIESFNFSFEVNSSNGFNINRARSRSNMNNDVFMTDANSDGLMDVVNNNLVLFNHLNSSNGNITFSPSSNNTENQIITASIGEYVNNDDLIEPAMTVDSDPVKMWVAPRSGQIIIRDLISSESLQSNTNVFYSIETKNSSLNNNLQFRLYKVQVPVQNQQISVSIDNYLGNNPPLGLGFSAPLNVEKGQIFFFRLTGLTNQQSEVVTTSPEVEYVDISSDKDMLDEVNLTQRRSKYSNAFILTSEKPYEISRSGTLSISWPDILFGYSETPRTSDDVTYRIIYELGSVREEIYRRTILKNTQMSMTVTTNDIVGGHNFSFPYQITLDESKNEIANIYFEVFSESTNRWVEIDWKPTVSFLPLNPLPNTYYNTGEFYPIANYSSYKTTLQRTIIPPNNWTFPNTPTNYSILPNSNVTLQTGDYGKINMIVKKGGYVIGKQVINIINGFVDTSNFSPILLESDFLPSASNPFSFSIGFYPDNKLDSEICDKFLQASNGISAFLGYDWNNPANQLPLSIENLYNEYNSYGTMYRQWGQFFYNPSLTPDNASLENIILQDDFNFLIKPDFLYNLDNIDLSNLDTDLDISQCENLPTEQEQEDCYSEQLINNSLDNLNIPIPDEDFTDAEMDDLESQIDDSNLNFTQFISPVLFSEAARYYQDDAIELTERWINFINDAQYISQFQSRDGNISQSSHNNTFNDEEDDENYTYQMDTETGMRAISRYTKSTAKSLTMGYGPINLNRSRNGYTHLLSDFRDINGDGYPDLLTSTKLQLTKPTGGLNNTILNHNLGVLTNSNSDIRKLIVKAGAAFPGRHPESQEDESEDSGTESKQKENEANIIGALYSTLGLFSVDINLSGKNVENVMYTDINGDGLDDKIFKINNSYSVCFNNGILNQFGNATSSFHNTTKLNESKPNMIGVGVSIPFVQDIFNLLPLPAGIQVSAGANFSGGKSTATFMDINGDGLQDLIRPNANGDVVAHLNFGNKFSSEEYKIRIKNSSLSDTFSLGSNETTNFAFSAGAGKFFGKSICCLFIRILHIKAGITANYDASLSVGKSDIGFHDINGDGYTDYVKRDGGSLKVYYSRIGKTNLLKEVITPTAARYEVDYAHENLSFDNPRSKWTMRSLKISNPNAINAPASTIENFEYRNGFYDRRERAFYGYEKVISKESATTVNSTQLRTVVRTYHNKNYFLEGNLIEESTFDGDENGNLISKSNNTFQIYPLETDGIYIDVTNSSLPNTFDTGHKEGRRSAAVLLLESKNYIYENGANPIVTSTRYKYDKYGNIIQYFNNGNDNISDDNYYATINYHDNSSTLGIIDNNFLRVPKQIKVFDNSGNCVRRRENNQISAFGQIQKFTAFSDVNDNANALETSLSYNSDGLIESIILPNNQTYEYVYDNLERKYLVQITDGFNYQNTATYDYKFDKPLITKDRNNQEIRYQYDSMGRLTHVISPREIGTNPQRYTLKFNYYPTYGAIANLPNNSCITPELFNPFSVTEHLDVLRPSNSIRTISIVDALGHQLQTKKDIEVNEETDPLADPILTEKMSVSGNIVYDDFDRVIKQGLTGSEPLDLCRNYIYNNEIPFDYFSETVYDVRNRVLSTKAPNLTQTNFIYFHENDLFGVTESTDNYNGTIQTTTLTDVFSRTIATKALGPDGEAITSFQYNSIGELMSVTDPIGLQSSYQYDNLGRKILYHNPDSGDTRYIFDGSGNLGAVQTQSLYNQNQQINYSYQLGRLTSIDFPTVAGSPNISDVLYIYGSASDNNPLNRGRLIAQYDATGEQLFQYGKLGEVIQTRRTIISPIIGSQPETYVTTYNYDSFNRILSITYPDGEDIRYDYNRGGKLKSILSRRGLKNTFYVKRIDYNEFEQRTALVHGNGVVTKYDYSPDMRWIKNLNVDTGIGTLINQDYVYDNIGNIIQTIGNAAPADFFGGQYQNNYEYDVLNRLKRAEGTFSGAPNQPDPGNTVLGTYALNMQYDNSGRIIKKQQTHNDEYGTNSNNTFQFDYQYAENTHRPIELVNSVGINNFYFNYDENGNQISKTEDGQTSFMVYDELNRLRLVGTKKKNNLQHNIYDANGERTLKATSDYEEFYVNGQLVSPTTTNFSSYTLYVNPYYTKSSNGQITKHYFADTQRIASQVSGGQSWQRPPAEANDPYAETVPLEVLQSPILQDPDTIKTKQQQDVNNYLQERQLQLATFIQQPSFNEGPCSQFPPGTEEYEFCCALNPGVCNDTFTGLVYYYHPDHLGSSTAITDKNGKPYQFFLNLPFGETFVEQNTFGPLDNQYKFNGKELDVETGLYYYGARFYDPRVSFWYGVDPLAEKYPGMSPYNFCFNNPLRVVDPDGREGQDWVKKGNKWSYVESITTPAQAKAAGYDDFRANGSIISNARIGSGSIGDVYLGAGGNSHYATAEDYALANGGKSFGNSFWNGNQGGAYLYSGGFSYDSKYAGISGNHQFLTASAFDNTGTGYLPLALDLGGSVSGATGSISGRLGTSNFGAYSNANGSIFTADGNISAGIFTGEGNKKGLMLDANIGAYAAKGEYTLGGTLAGFKFQQTIGGSLLSAHAGWSSNFYYNGNNGSINIDFQENFGWGLGQKYGFKIQIPLPFKD